MITRTTATATNGNGPPKAGRRRVAPNTGCNWFDPLGIDPGGIDPGGIDSRGTDPLGTDPGGTEPSGAMPPPRARSSPGGFKGSLRATEPIPW
jgi:hypothetical protein